MKRARSNSVITTLLFVVTLFSCQLSYAQDGYNVVASKNFSTKLKTQQPIDIDLEVNGVRLNSVFFDNDKLEAFLILQNRTPAKVTTEVGVALFDSKGKLVATGIDVSEFSFSGDTIDAGDHKNVKLAFPKFINDYSQAKTFQLVFSIVEPEMTAKTYKPTNNVD